MLILIKYWRILVPFIIIVVGLAGFHFWLSARLEQEKNEAIALINQQTKEKILNDTIEVVEAFKPSDAINSTVDGVLSDYTAKNNSDSGGLLGTREKTTPDNGGETRPDSVLQSGLSAAETEFLQDYPELLQ